jgi:SpoVK/Ycf46/Vps4 family AAA+-type ATPase
MTPTQQAKLEQVAREFLEAPPMSIATNEEPETVAALVALLANTERATLERVADEMERHPYWSKEAEVWIKHLRQLAKEIHP